MTEEYSDLVTLISDHSGMNAGDITRSTEIARLCGLHTTMGILAVVEEVFSVDLSEIDTATDCVVDIYNAIIEQT